MVHSRDQEEYFFACPHCWQRISMLVDLSIAEQEFIEDCEVCCRPIRIQYVARNGAVHAFNASDGT
jgi:hypothetical protein